jgi:hypothetical protein
MFSEQMMLKDTGITISIHSVNPVTAITYK